MSSIKGKVLKFERKLDSVRRLDVRRLTPEQIHALDVLLLSEEQISIIGWNGLSDEQLDIYKRANYMDKEIAWVKGLTDEQMEAVKRGELLPPPELFL